MIVSELLYEALRLAGVLHLSGRISSATEMTDAFGTLNRVVDGMNADGLMIYAIERKVCTLAASTSSYTIGPAATFNFARPPKIEAAAVVVGLTEQKIEVCTPERWTEITNKGEITNYGPRALFYERISPIGNVHIAPMPSGTMSMTLYVWAQLTAFASQAVTVTLPTAYARCIIYNLAVELSLAPRFRRFKMDPGVAALAKEYRLEIGALNVSLNQGEVAKAA